MPALFSLPGPGLFVSLIASFGVDSLASRIAAPG